MRVRSFSKRIWPLEVSNIILNETISTDGSQMLTPTGYYSLNNLIE